MAGHLNLIEACHRRWVLLLLVLPGALALGQNAFDPTRPPDPPKVSNLNPSATGGLGSPVPATGPVLQSVLMSDTHAEAIIDGRVVRIGDRIALGKVVSISESEVTLRTNAGLQTLKLFPGIEKRYAVAPHAGAPVRRNKTKPKQ